MNRMEKVRLSADEGCGHGFRHGVFVRFYERTLYWFCLRVRELKPMLEPVKGGMPLIYGGLPAATFEALLERGALPGAERTEYGWRWPYAEFSVPDASSYASWREKIVAARAHTAEEQKGDFLAELVADVEAFNLAASTPLEAMQAIYRWQCLLGRKRAG